MQNLNRLQEVYFDLMDLLSRDPKLCQQRVNGFDEFKTLRDLIAEQCMKLETIEKTTDWSN